MTERREGACLCHWSLPRSEGVWSERVWSRMVWSGGLSAGGRQPESSHTCPLPPCDTSWHLRDPTALLSNLKRGRSPPHSFQLTYFILPPSPPPSFSVSLCLSLLHSFCLPLLSLSLPSALTSSSLSHKVYNVHVKYHQPTHCGRPSHWK